MGSLLHKARDQFHAFWHVNESALTRIYPDWQGMILEHMSVISCDYSTGKQAGREAGLICRELHNSGSNCSLVILSSLGSGKVFPLSSAFQNDCSMMPNIIQLFQGLDLKKNHLNSILLPQFNHSDAKTVCWKIIFINISFKYGVLLSAQYLLLALWMTCTLCDPSSLSK